MTSFHCSSFSVCQAASCAHLDVILHSFRETVTSTGFPFRVLLSFLMCAFFISTLIFRKRRYHLILFSFHSFFSKGRLATDSILLNLRSPLLFYFSSPLRNGRSRLVKDCPAIHQVALKHDESLCLKPTQFSLGFLAA